MAAKVEAKRTRNWKELDAAHRRRGELVTVIFSQDASTQGELKAVGKKGGRKQRYPDTLIEALLTVKVVLRLSLRALEGFAAGMVTLTGASWSVPDYTTLCRRERHLSVDIATKLSSNKRHILMVDSTGLKVFGEGEWKVRQHGTDGKRRTWRKIHLLVDRESGHVTAVEVTPNNVADCAVLPALLPSDLCNTLVLGDGAYHTKKLHRDVHAKGGVLLSPPPVNATVWRPYHCKAEPAFAFRNAPLQRLGRTEWKIQSGCAKRSYVEAMMHRLKSITGDKLSARTMDRQVVEVRLRVKVLNATATSTMKVAV
ncbi:MAG: IS5 family transposase [Agitococcus sp.]|nr:IS5 family transposase [Agitococcus sp.]